MTIEDNLSFERLDGTDKTARTDRVSELVRLNEARIRSVARDLEIKHNATALCIDGNEFYVRKINNFYEDDNRKIYVSLDISDLKNQVKRFFNGSGALDFKNRESSCITSCLYYEYKRSHIGIIEIENITLYFILVSNENFISRRECCTIL